MNEPKKTSAQRTPGLVSRDLPRTSGWLCGAMFQRVFRPPERLIGGYLTPILNLESRPAVNGRRKRHTF